MGIRYNNRSTKRNNSELYEEILEGRDLKQVDHYRTPAFEQLTLANRYSVQNIHHIWSVGDRYWKLAEKHYANPGLWWVIAWYNQKPTDAHVKIGDSIAIPLPLNRALKLFYR